MKTETLNSTLSNADKQRTHVVRRLVWWQLLFLLGVIAGLGLFEPLPFLKG